TRVRAARRAVTVGFTLAELARVFSERDRGGVPCRQVLALAQEKLRRLDEAIVETRKLRRQLGRIVGSLDRRLKAYGKSQRVNLLHLLETLPFAAGTRANPQKRGWQRR